MNNVLLMGGGKPPVFSYRAVVLAGQTTTPKLTFAAGAPSAVVDWGDGTAQSAVTSGIELSHTYTNAGTYLVKLIMSRQNLWLTQIDINTDYARLSTIGLIKFKKLTHLICHSGSNAITGPVSGLPVGLTVLDCWGGSNAITGPVSGLPVGLTYLSCAGGSNAITGPVSGLPVGLTVLSCWGSSNAITGPVSGLPVNIQTANWYGGSNAPSAGAPPSKIQRLEIQNNAMSQATVDAILLSMYAARATYTYATPVLNIGGTNAAPSGTYADQDPPTTGKAAAYELVNDPETEGFKKWTITFTA